MPGLDADPVGAQETMIHACSVLPSPATELTLITLHVSSRVPGTEVRRDQEAEGTAATYREATGL